MPAAVPPNESARLQALHGYHILDTLPEREFDDLTKLAARVCRTPVAALSLVDADRQWLKSSFGLNAWETTRDEAFCAHAILQNEIMIVPDAKLDPRFANLHLVTGPYRLRFYAGVPLTTPDGLNLGTLCVMDTAPRELGAEARESLQILAHQAMTQLQLRRALDNFIADAPTLSSEDFAHEARM